MDKYSKKLVTRLQRYFKEKHNEDVTNEDAQTYLESLATLFTAFKK